jgi:hypothetical protein
VTKDEGRRTNQAEPVEQCVRQAEPGNEETKRGRGFMRMNAESICLSPGLSRVAFGRCPERSSSLAAATSTPGTTAMSLLSDPGCSAKRRRPWAMELNAVGVEMPAFGPRPILALSESGGLHPRLNSAALPELSQRCKRFLINGSTRRHERWDRLAAVLAVNREVVVEGDDF